MAAITTMDPPMIDRMIATPRFPVRTREIQTENKRLAGTVNTRRSPRAELSARSEKLPARNMTVPSIVRRRLASALSRATRQDGLE
jgi:hypothetical protein